MSHYIRKTEGIKKETVKGNEGNSKRIEYRDVPDIRRFSRYPVSGQIIAVSGRITG